MKNKLYKVFDSYSEDMELLGTCDTIEEVLKIENQRVDETDGECYLLRTKRDDILKRYVVCNPK